MKHIIIVILLIFSTTLTAQLVYDVREVYYSQEIGIDADEVDWIDVRDRDVKVVIEDNQMHITDNNGKRTKVRLVSFDMVETDVIKMNGIDSKGNYLDIGLTVEEKADVYSVMIMRGDNFESGFWMIRRNK